MKTRRRWMTLLILLIPCLALSQGSVRGIVSDSTTKEALVGANILVKGTALGSVSDREGRFKITGVPVGQQVLRFTYIGYATKELTVPVADDAEVVVNVQLGPEVIEGQEVVVTAQARGQVAAINQQLHSNTIVNVISEEKIKELPDANAAEAIGRLPGISIIRSGGEANKVILRGMSDKFTSFTIDGIRVPPTDADSRGVDLSTFSQGTLAGVEVFKALTSDKDGDAIAGSVNLVTRKAPDTRRVRVDLKGAYNRLDKSLDQYDMSGHYGERFFDNVLGVQVLANLERRIRSNESVAMALDQANPARPLISDFTVQYTNEVRKRSGASLLLDVNTPDEGTIRLNTIFSRTDRDYMIFARDYPQGADVFYSGTDREQRTMTFNSALRGENLLLGQNVTWGISFAQSKSDYPWDFRMLFSEPSGMRGASRDTLESNSPEWLIPLAKNDFGKAKADTAYFRFEKNLDRERTAYLDIENKYALSEDISGAFKFGGKLRYKNRFKETSEQVSYYYNGFYRQWARLADGSIVRKSSLFRGTRFENLMTDPQNPRLILLTNFLDVPPVNRNLFSRYFLNPMINRSALREWYELNRNGLDSASRTPEYYDNPETRADAYDIIERVGAGYVMNTINFGPLVTFIAGVRIEAESNDYKAYYVSSALSGFPTIGTLVDTTSAFKETAVLPNFQLTVRPTDHINVRLAAYRALARPDFNFRLDKYIVRITNPRNIVTIGNSRLKNAKAWNFEANTSFFGNDIGLVSVSAFYREIKDMFHLATSIPGQGNYLFDTLGIPWHPPTPPSPVSVTFPYNSPGKTKVWGFEFEHQANLNFLPGFLQNFVLSYNFSLVRSETNIFTRTLRVDTIEVYDPEFGWYKVPIFSDVYSTTKQRLEAQPEFFGNVALGYDIGGFSARVSVFFQGEYNSSYSASGLSDRVQSKFSRWDVAVRQRITENISLFFNLNNFTSIEEEALAVSRVYGWSRLNSNSKYGLTGDLGVRIEL